MAIVGGDAAGQDASRAPGTGQVITAGWVLTPDAGNGVELLEQVAIAVRGTRIEYVGPLSGLPPYARAWRHFDARDQLVIPGFVNTHNHAAMTLLRGYADDLPLMRWLNEAVWPAERELTARDVYWGTLLAAAEQIKAGITTFVDMYFYWEDAAAALAKAGVRAQITPSLAGIDPAADALLASATALFEQWDGFDDDRITVALGPHAPYTCPDAFVERVVAEARRLEAPLHMHLAETAAEVEQWRRERGMTPIAWAVERGLASTRLLAIHAVHVTPADLDLMAEHGIAVSHNPISNAKLASGIAPVRAMLDRGLVVGLGTDGACSTNHLNMFEQMRLAAWLGKLATGDPAAFRAAEAFRMATVAGARCLGYNDVGRIAEGYRADLVCLATDAAHFHPRHDWLSHVVYAAQTVDVRHVMVHGRWLVQDGEIVTFDAVEAAAQCHERGLRLAATARRRSSETKA